MAPIPSDAQLQHLAAQAAAAVRQRRLMLVTAESCTGGWIAKALTDLPGSSAWFHAGVVTYSYEAKEALLGVNPRTLESQGAVSEATALEMVSGALARLGAGVAVAVTGIAGPTGGTPDKPVVTVWISGAPTDGGRRAHRTAGNPDRLTRRAPPDRRLRCGILAALSPRQVAPRETGMADHALHLHTQPETSSMDDNKRKALTSALGQIEKQFGKGAIMRMGDRVNEAIDVISTGSLGLDIALGVGGLPRGRVVEIYGPESSGKTTMTLQVIAACQRAGGTAAFIDAEHALDPTYAEKLGVKVDDLLVSQPDTGEQALEIADMLVRSCAVDIVVVDSVAALTPKAEIEGEMGDSHVGLHARLMSQALRKLTANIKKSAPKRGSRWSRTRLRHRFANASSRSSTAKAPRAKARSSSWAWPKTSSTNPAPGTATRATASARARTTCASSCASIRK